MKIFDKIPVRRVLMSVSDKSNIDILVNGLVEMNPDVSILSTGGTFKAIAKVLGEEKTARNLLEVADYTGCPEMQNGYVKTLQGVLHAGILADRGVDNQLDYITRAARRIVLLGDDDPNSVFDAETGKEYQIRLEERKAGYIDMVVVNFYPFEQTVAKEGITVAEAIENIDIGGPTMVRAAAKRWHGCASVCDPEHYVDLLHAMGASDGCTTLDQRFELSQRAFLRVANYDNAINNYLRDQDVGDAVKGAEVIDRLD